jgi:hypothetical protein
MLRSNDISKGRIAFLELLTLRTTVLRNVEENLFKYTA